MKTAVAIVVSAVCLAVSLAPGVEARERAGTPGAPAAVRVGGAGAAETLTVPFIFGGVGVRTANAYRGATTVTVSGVGQASGMQKSDAFYIFTDTDGKAIRPYHSNEYYNAALWIDFGPADRFLRQIPAYNPLHIYQFQIDAPGGQLRFGVGDGYAADNRGAYKVHVRDGRVADAPAR